MSDTKGQEGEPPFELWSSLMLYLVRTLRACNVQYWVDGFRVMQPSVDWLDWFVACVVWTYLTIFWMRGGEASVPKISLQEAQLQRIGHKRQAALLLQLHTYYGRCWKTFSVPNACVVGKKWNNEMQCRWSGSGIISGSGYVGRFFVVGSLCIPPGCLPPELHHCQPELHHVGKLLISLGYIISNCQ